MVVPTPRNLVVHVSYASGAPGEKVVVDHARALVGSGAHCDVCLPPGVAAVEQFELVVDDNGIQIQSRAADPPATLDGAPFNRTRLGTDSIVSLGDARIKFELVESGDGKGKKRKGIGAVGYACVFIAIPALLFVVLAEEDEAEANSRPPPQPSLWSSKPAECPNRDPQGALAAGFERLGHAEGRRERHKFDVREGVSAVELFDSAAACFRVAGHTADAEGADQSAKLLRMKVDEDYRGHQIRLEHALSVDEVDTAQREVRFLHAYTQSATGVYVRWLEGTERALEVKRKANKEKAS